MSRKAMPAKTRDALLNEYNHKCAVCGGDHPQVHHIDEDHSNNELENLLPLCPNCHLRDQHNPTRKIDIQKLALFRKYKDPAILKPQFDPIYRKQIFLSEIEINDEPTNYIEQQANELTYFVLSLDMGEFYGKKIYQLVRPVGINSIYILDRGTLHPKISHCRPDQKYEYKNLVLKSYREYRQKLVDNKEDVQEAIIELLRYQKWTNV